MATKALLQVQSIINIMLPENIFLLLEDVLRRIKMNKRIASRLKSELHPVLHSAII